MNLFRLTKPFAFTIFGASGDLAKVKLFPALYALMEQKRFIGDFLILGFGRSNMSTTQFRKQVEKSIRDHGEGSVDQQLLKKLVSHVEYCVGQYDDEKSFSCLANAISTFSRGKKIPVVHYLAVPPEVFSPVIQNLANLKKRLGEDMKLVIEKPFGYDEASARELYHLISMHFQREQIFLLDHYLGKEAVQSILAIRYANGILNTLLSGPLISNIQVTAFEDIGVSSRIHYFEQVGIIKDMIQSHLLQVLALLTMDLPVDQKADNIHREKFAILSALKYRGYEKALVLGQHESYRKIKGVKSHSNTPTFTALRLFIDRQQWYQVPIYIRTGKMLSKKHTYVVVEFKKHPFQVNNPDVRPNKLILELQPEEKLSLKLYTKVGGTLQRFHDLTTSESLACFGDDCLPEHGRLLLNVFQGDQSNFLSFEEIIASWRFTDKLLRTAEKKKVPVHPYKDFSDGPEAQHLIPKQDGFAWLNLAMPKS